MLAAYDGKRNSVKELIAHGAQLELKDKGGSTAIHWASLSNNLNLIDDLLDCEVNALAVDYNGWTSLMKIGIYCYIVI